MSFGNLGSRVVYGAVHGGIFLGFVLVWRERERLENKVRERERERNLEIKMKSGEIGRSTPFMATRSSAMWRRDGHIFGTRFEPRVRPYPSPSSKKFMQAVRSYYSESKSQINILRTIRFGSDDHDCASYHRTMNPPT